MPKIEINEKHLYADLPKWSLKELEDRLVQAKAELDGYDKETGAIKIELNDTNRPDLWSTRGLVRILTLGMGGAMPQYGFFSTEAKQHKTAGREVLVRASAQEARPYLAAFAVKGHKLNADELEDLIQSQEKLCWNFGRKRKSVSMGLYRSALCEYPISFEGVDPDKTSFVPLGMSEKLSLREINKKHPKDQEFGHITEGLKAFPLLRDAKDSILSYPPVINSADLGAVEAGDEELFVEISGTVQTDVVLTASIMACDMSEMGFEILPVRVKYEYDTPMGRELVCPWYFQQSMDFEKSYVERLLGLKLSDEELVAALARMGVVARKKSRKKGCDLWQIDCPAYRNDFIHPVDVVEDVLIGRGIDSFEPTYERVFTQGGLQPAEEFARKVGTLMVGMGFQEMMFNYLGSKADYAGKMQIPCEGFVEISNPMTENYALVRKSILPALLGSEGVSANAVYPHRLFETGKVAYLKEGTDSGTHTANHLGFSVANGSAGYSDMVDIVNALCFYLGVSYELRAHGEDGRFIPGRVAELWAEGRFLGVLGEIHPALLEAWNIPVPVIACELDLDELLAISGV